ncbi:hypothetical protein ACQ4PT_042991 [Festuca glaucescens]
MLPLDLIEEILLLLPPDEPGGLFRASAVCKPWRSLITCSRFGSRYREFHGTPPLLGFFEIDHAFGAWFAPSSPTSPFPPVHPDPRDLFVFDSRQGLLLLRTPGWIDENPAESLIVWDPVRRRQWEFPPPEFADDILYDNAVVLCAADHLGYRGGPFTVVYVGTVGPYASVFSSETRAWSAVATIPDPDPDPDVYIEIMRYGPNALVGNVLYFACSNHIILRFDLLTRELSTIQGPMPWSNLDYHVLVKTEEGVLACAIMWHSELCLWSMETGPNGTVAWTQNRVVKLDKQLRPCGLLGFVDGLFYLKKASCIFTVELKSGRVKKIPISRFSAVSDCALIPYMSFYTPDEARPRTLPSTMAPSSDGQVGYELGKREDGDGWEEVSAEKECHEEEEHKEGKTVQELFDKWSKAFKDGDFVCAVDFFQRALNIRVAHHGKLSPKCFSTYVKYGRALLGYTILEIESASNQELVEGITMQNDARHSQEQNSNGKMIVIFLVTYLSDLDLAWRMFHVARSILEKSPGSTMEKVEILATLAEVSMQGEDIAYSLIACFKALANLEHLVEPDHRHIFDLNLQIRFAFEMESKIGDVKAISLCKSHIEGLKRANEDFLADKGDDASAATESGSYSLAKCIKYLTDKLLRALEKKIQLEDMEEAISSPVSEAIGEQNVGNDVPRAESLASSQCSGPSNPMPTGSTITDLEDGGRGIKRANVKQASSEHSPKKFAGSSPSVKVDSSNSSDGHLSASDSDDSVSE